MILNIDKDTYDKKSLNKGASRLYEKEEKELINFIEFNRKLFNPITTISLLIKFLELVPERKKKSYKSNYRYICRILKRNSYTFRTKTHFGQVLDNNCYVLTSNFLNEV